MLDAVSVITAVGAAQLLRFSVQTPQRNYFWVSALISVCWMSVLAINNSRSHRIIGAGAEEYRRVWLCTMSVFGGVAIISMLLKLEIARGYLMIALPTGLTLLAVSRWLARRWVSRERKNTDTASAVCWSWGRQPHLGI